MSVIVAEPLKLLWLPHTGAPIWSKLDARHREPLLEQFRKNFLSSVPGPDPQHGRCGSPSQFKKASLIEPILVFPCGDGIVVQGGLQAGLCPDHGDPLVSASMTSLSETGLPPEIREVWARFKNPGLRVEQCVQTFQHTAIVFHGFYLSIVQHGHEKAMEGFFGLGKSGQGPYGEN